ncbi:MAG: PAS domain-containing protein [Bacteroidia bacterium]
MHIHEQTAFEYLPDTCYVIDRKYRLLAFNSVAFRYFQDFDDIELRHQLDMLGILPEYLKDEWKTWYDRCLEGNTFVEERVYDFQGKVLRFELHFCSLPIIEKSGPRAMIWARDLSRHGRHAQQADEIRDRLELTLDIIDDGLFDINLQSEIFYVNSKWYEMLGYQNGAFLLDLQTFYRLIHHDDVAHVRSIFEKIKKGELERLSLEYRILCSDGGYKWVFSRATVIHSKNSDQQRLIGTHVDISAQKHQHQLQAAHEKLLDALYKASTQLLVHKVNVEKRIGSALQIIGEASRATHISLYKYVESNKALVRYFWNEADGFSSLPWTPESQANFCKPIPDAVRVDGLKQTNYLSGPVDLDENRIEGLLQGGKKGSFLVVPIETGNLHWGFLLLHDTNDERPWLPANIQIMLNFGIAIAHAKDSAYHEDELSTLNQQLESAHKIAGLASFEYEIESDQFKWSPGSHHIYGLARNDDLNRENLECLLLPEDATRRKMAWRALLEKQEPYDLTYKIHLPSGDRRVLHAKGDIVKYASSDRSRVLGTIQDITRFDEASREIAKKNADLESVVMELDQFAYIVSHDLKAPLRAINNLVNWIAEDLGDSLSKEVESHFTLLRSRTERMGLLIDGILEYSRAGRSQSELVGFELGSLVKEVLQLLGIGDNGVQVELGELPFLHTEKLKLQQVLSNLISNARKYGTSEKPWIRIWSESQSETCSRIFVADNGPGIPAAYQDQIFNIFTMLKKPEDNSTGIGLAIVKKIVEERGGKVWVESTPGNGACFIVDWVW